jgi:hypothetical protein
MLSCRLVHHPARHPCKSAIWLADHEDLRPLMTVATLYRNDEAMPRMEPVEYSSLGLLIPGSMSLLRAAPGKRTSQSQSPETASAPGRADASSTPSIWSIASRLKAALVDRAGSLTSLPVLTSSSSTNSVTYPSRKRVDNCYSTLSAASTNALRSSSSRSATASATGAPCRRRTAVHVRCGILPH